PGSHTLSLNSSFVFNAGSDSGSRVSLLSSEIGGVVSVASGKTLTITAEQTNIRTDSVTNYGTINASGILDIRSLNGNLNVTDSTGSISANEVDFTATLGNIAVTQNSVGGTIKGSAQGSFSLN